MQAVPGVYERVLFSRLSKNAYFRSANYFQNFRAPLTCDVCESFTSAVFPTWTVQTVPSG